MDYTYLIILVGVLIISPFVLKLSINQGEKTKQNLKYAFIFIILAQILLGFLNWETFKGMGRNGFELSITYPNSFLGLFFIVSIIQILLLLINKSFNTLVVVLNFLNTFLIFIGMIRLSNMLGYQVASLASIATVFLVLIGNVVGLVLINKDKNLLKKYSKY